MNTNDKNSHCDIYFISFICQYVICIPKIVFSVWFVRVGLQAVRSSQVVGDQSMVESSHVRVEREKPGSDGCCEG